MEYMSEDHLKLLLNKEWLVKVDTDKSIPYLLKFYSSTVDQCCCIMITDTKNVWGEVMSSKQFARRWRICNPSHAPLTSSTEEEDEWRTQVLEFLSAAHSIGGISDLNFEIVTSQNADLAFELSNEEFKWRWETYALGPKMSADVLSQHLIMPLISVTHLAFSSADPVSELSEPELEKSVDKVGRTARRTMDMHVKHAISRPRVATTLRRMTAVFSFFPDLPSICSKVKQPELKPPTGAPRSRTPSKAPYEPSTSRPVSQDSSSRLLRAAPSASGAQSPPTALQHDVNKRSNDDSATEQSGDEESPFPSENGKGKRKETESPMPPSHVSLKSAVSKPVSTVSSHQPSPPTRQEQSDSSSSPARPQKKSKRMQPSSSSEDESEGERKKGSAQSRGGGQKGPKQPLKRTARRF